MNHYHIAGIKQNTGEVFTLYNRQPLDVTTDRDLLNGLGELPALANMAPDLMYVERGRMGLDVCFRHSGKALLTLIKW